MNLEKLENFLKESNQPRFRLDQIIKAVYQDGVFAFSEIKNIPKDLRGALDENIEILPFKENKILVSMDKRSIKASLRLKDGSSIETVLISMGTDIWSACLSCQVGCPMGCAFCATGTGGFKRNLTSEEIADQILFWKQYLRKNKIPGKISNIVYMGMGEPFLNWEAVKLSLKGLTDKKTFGFGSRSISVSTVGVPGGISQLANDFPQINLAISLHFCDNTARSEFMPANKGFNLENIKKDLEKYFDRSSRKVFIEYILFKDINDDVEDAKKLVSFVRGFKKHKLLHVNLIRYNLSQDNKNFTPASQSQMLKFEKYLLENGVNCTIRKSLGSDIQGACGQLTLR